MDKNLSLKEALKTVVEVKLLGTYRIAAMESNEAKTMYLVKNSGAFSIGLSKDNDELVVSSDMEIFSAGYLGK
jgi:glucosamine 6-phosphate synthetase-like amidotransferase/phosphosugar isomerase protein